MKEEQIAKAIKGVFSSPNVADSNMEPANLVDTTDNLARAMFAVASAIRSGDAEASSDDYGGKVDSLTEAAMGMTKGLHDIATAIRDLADMLAGHKDIEP